MTGAFKVGGQPEGCVVDDEAGRLYVGEEDVAIWRFPVDAPDGTRPVQVAAIDGIRLTADVEGLAVTRDRGKRSEAHTSELQALMRISYAVFCLQKQTTVASNVSTSRDANDFP